LHLCEATRSFRGQPRPVALTQADDFARLHVLDAASRFHPEYRWGFSRHAPFFRRKDVARKNETIQRNHVHDVLDLEDDDIVILSDVDEIIDSRHADEIVEMARKHGVISIRMHHSLFFLNLYSTNWHELWDGAPPDYAYRVFVMTGRYFRARRFTSDRIRRLGEWGRLASEVTLLGGMRGFHHSWLGDEKAALAKLQAYSHQVSDHVGELYDGAGAASLDRLGRMIREGRSIFPGNRLEVRGFDEIEPLGYVAENAERFAHLVLPANA
jgi:hypothetical protein